MNHAEIAILRDLIALRRAGAIAAVYCDAGVLRVVFHDGKVIAARKPSRYKLVLAIVQGAYGKGGRMSPARIKREVERCDEHIAAFREQRPLPPALISTLGITDWQIERELILREIPPSAWPEEWIADALFPERRGWPCRAYRTLGAKTALVEFFDGTAVFTAAANVRERSAGANPLREGL